MPSPIYIIGGILFSLISGYITWLSWRDTRAIYSILSKFEKRIEELEKQSSDKDQLLRS